MHFFLGGDISYPECCEKHVWIHQKRYISEGDHALDSGGNGLGPMPLVSHAGRLCLEGDLAPWVRRPTCCPWDWSTYSFLKSYGPTGWLGDNRVYLSSFSFLLGKTGFCGGSNVDPWGPGILPGTSLPLWCEVPGETPSSPLGSAQQLSGESEPQQPCCPWSICS